MSTDQNKSPTPDRAKDDVSMAADRLNREADTARTEARAAAGTIRDEAQGLASAARERAYEGADQGKESVAGSLDDFAAAVGKAADELGERDQSMAASLVREMATGLGDASRSIHGRSVDEIVRSVAGFARSRPTTFLLGAALAGVALGRFARSSSEHDQQGYSGDRGSRYPRGGATPGRDYGRSYVDQPRPTEGAYPRDRDPVTGAPRAGAASPGAPTPAGPAEPRKPGPAVGGTGPSATTPATPTTSTTGGLHGR